MNAATHTLNRSRSVVPASLAALLADDSKPAGPRGLAAGLSGQR